MKSFKLIIIIMGVLFLALLAGFILELRKNFRLKEEKNEKTNVVEQAQKVQQELEKVENEIAQLDLKETKIDEMIPHDEQEPMSLLKELSLLANQSGAKNLEIIYLGKNKTAALSQSEDSGLTGQENPPQAGEIPSPQTQNACDSLQVKPQFIQMNFESEFGRLIIFLGEVLKLKRLVSVESVRVERVEKILPRQKISLVLSAYTF